MSKIKSFSVIYVKCGKSMFKKIKSVKTTKKFPGAVDLSWKAQEKFLAKIREELKKKLVNMRNRKLV